MTDLEMTIACAKAMGFRHNFWLTGKVFIYTESASNPQKLNYDPLRDDAQAMALVDKFKLDLEAPREDRPEWWAYHWYDVAPIRIGKSADRRRAIVECVARMRDAVRGAEAAIS